MSAWEYILNAAMLGTDKQGAGKSHFSEELAEVFELIDGVPEHDKETRFLNMAAAVFNFRQCGLVPPRKPNLLLNPAPAEFKHYCSAQASAVLNAILQENNPALLEMWLLACDKQALLIIPEMLPDLLEKAAQNNSLKHLVISCSGNRGLWISQFNSAWDYFHTLPNEEVWQTGKLEERVKVLKELRQTSPDTARDWLQQTWQQENAASKTDLLKCLRVNATPSDLPWFESLLTEKAQKVKDEAMAILKQTPCSSIIMQYEALLRESVILKKEKALLGMMNKTSIQLKLPSTIDEHIYKSGIEKLAGPKSAINDNDFVIYQLISFVPPAFWEKHFEATPGKVVEYFEKHSPSLSPALGLAVARFNENDWIPHFFKQDEFYVDYVNMLAQPDREKYLLRFLDKDPRTTKHHSLNEIERWGWSVATSDVSRASNKDIIHHSLGSNQEWSMDFALSAIKYMANNPYQYNRGFYSQNINLIPVGMLNQLERIESKDPNLQPAWDKVRMQLFTLLDLKNQIKEAFNN